MITVEDVQRLICFQFDVTMRDMVSARTAKKVAVPRMVAMFLARELTSLSLPKIGTAFGNRHHTTVMHAVKRVLELTRDDPDLFNRVEAAQILLGDKPVSDDDDEPMALTGFVPLGDQERAISQDEVDRSASFTGPVLHIFEKIPAELVPAVMSSVVLTWCMKFADAEEALDWLHDQWKQALPRLRAAKTATRQ